MIKNIGILETRIYILCFLNIEIIISAIASGRVENAELQMNETVDENEKKNIYIEKENANCSIVKTATRRVWKTRNNRTIKFVS